MRTPIRTWIGGLVIAVVVLAVALGYGTLWAGRFASHRAATSQGFVKGKLVAQRRADEERPYQRLQPGYERRQVARDRSRGTLPVVAHRTPKDRARELEARGLRPSPQG